VADAMGLRIDGKSQRNDLISLFYELMLIDIGYRRETYSGVLSRLGECCLKGQFTQNTKTV
jgi:hypothetical protein